MATVLRDVSDLQMHIQPTMSGVNIPITQSATGLSGQTSSRQPHQGRGETHPDRTRAQRERRHREGDSRQKAASPGARPRGNTSRQDAARGASARKHISTKAAKEGGGRGTHLDGRSPSADAGEHIPTNAAHRSAARGNDADRPERDARQTLDRRSPGDDKDMPPILVDHQFSRVNYLTPSRTNQCPK